MALFYFHLSDGRTLMRDSVGLEFPDLRSARDAAQIVLARHADEATAAGHPFPDRTSIEICDEAGQVLDIEWCWCLVRNPTPFTESQNPNIETANESGLR